MKTVHVYILAFATCVIFSGCGDSMQGSEDLKILHRHAGACYSSEHCGPGTVCAQFGEEASAGRCYRACYVEKGECPSNSVCSPIRDGVSTSSGARRAPDGACVPLVENPQERWSVCTSSRDCGPSLRCTLLPGAETGYCLRFCTSDTGCGEGASRCQLSLQREDGSSLQACVVSCVRDSDCSQGEYCTTVGEVSVCTPVSE